MAQIFVSHSQLDKDLKDFFSRAFATTTVKAVYEEFEGITKGQRTRAEIAQDIEGSNAVFVILSHNVSDILHTRDWVVTEASIAKNKDIWVFEPLEQLGRIAVIIPYVRHYVVFGTSDAWFAYVKQIIESYDDSHVLPTVILSAAAIAGVSALFAKKDKASAAILGGLGGTVAGLGISDRSKMRPYGSGVFCKHCCSCFNVHLPQGLQSFRCPVCNIVLALQQ